MMNKMIKRFLTVFLIISSINALGQTYFLKGDVFSEDGNPMAYSSVVLLNPADSTMEFFGITNGEGHFEIKNIKKGSYLLQIAFLGFQTLYQDLTFPLEKVKILEELL